MSNSHKTARVQSQFLSTYIQPYSPHAKNDSDSCKDEKQLLPRSKCTTPEPFINNDSYKQSQQSHSLKHFPSQSYLQITPRNNESSHASKNSRRSPEPRCCICNQAGHYRSDLTNYSINTYKNHQDCSYSSKDKYLTPEPNTNNNILYHHQYSHIDYPHFNQSYQISQPNQQLQQSQQLSDSSKNKRITPEQNINNGIQHWQYIQTKDYSQLNYLPSQESQHSLIFSPSDHMKQNYSKNTQKNHQNQSYSLKNKRTTSEPNINQ
ncbi:3086_t:CDS:2, partial [Gigaspora rosea]